MGKVGNDLIGRRRIIHLGYQIVDQSAWQLLRDVETIRISVVIEQFGTVF